MIVTQRPIVRLVGAAACTMAVLSTPLPLLAQFAPADGAMPVQAEPAEQPEQLDQQDQPQEQLEQAEQAEQAEQFELAQEAEQAEPQPQQPQQPAQPAPRGPTRTPTPAQTLPPSTPAAPRNGAANGEQAEGAIRRANGGLILNFRDANIDVILDELSAEAGFIIVREIKPQGRVSLTSRQPVSPEDAVSLLNSVLYNAGYSAIQQGRILKIVARDRAKRLNIPVQTGSNPEAIEPTDQLITQVIPLRYADASQLRQDLQPLINPDADFTANASANALVITDTAANVRRVVQIINALDTSMAEAVSVRVFQLKYADATSTAELINNVFGDLMVATGDQSDSRGRGPGGGPGGGPGAWRDRLRQEAQREAQAAARGNKVKAAADQRTNSLVVTGSDQALAAVEEVLRELDENPVADETVFVYRLRNAQAANIEAVVNSIFGNQVSSTGTAQTGMERLQNLRGSGGRAGGVRSSGSLRSGSTGAARGGATGSMRGGAGGAGGIGQGTRLDQRVQQQARGGQRGVGRLSTASAQMASELAGQVSIIADPDTNSLLVRTSPANYERVKEILEELDRPVAQVLIKVLIAEVTHDGSLDLGTEFSVFNLRASGLGQTGRTDFNIPLDGPTSTGLVVQILEEDVTAAIRALETAGKLDVLSRPYILASDNQVASITVGQEIPFIVNSRITDEGGIVNTTQYDQIGILLDVIPHINPDGLVILDVSQEISSLTGNSVQINELFTQPIIAVRSALSRVGVQNGQTVVIGGLMEDRKTQTLDKVPLLGDIPLVGLLFQRNRTTTAKTELLIFLTPHVASEPELLERMSEEEVDGTKLIPNAVKPGVYDEHRRGLDRGRTAPPRSESVPEVPSVDEQAAEPVAPSRR